MTTIPALRGLSARLFAAMALVILAGAGTLLLVTLSVAPGVFQNHLDMVRPQLSAAVAPHIDEAFARATLIGLLAGVAAAVVVAGAAAWWVARRVSRPVAQIAGAAARLGEGMSVSLTDPGLGREFSSLTDAVSDLSARLAASEATRRRLLTDLAHQLRTPVAAIQATAEALLDGVLAADRSTLLALTGSGERLQRLVGDLERLSRAEEHSLEVRPRRVDLVDIAVRCVAAARPRFVAKGVDLVVAAPAQAPVHADPGRIDDVLSNLLDNALRHTPSGGAVQVEVTLLAQQHAVEVVVLDSGEGFRPEEHERLFERFYRASPRDSLGGSGVGLTIARALAVAHGGTIRATSDGPGTGASFTLSLPLASSTATRQERS